MENQHAFAKLVQELTTTPCLASPRFDRNFIIETDASKIAIAAVLLQADIGGKEHPMVYASRTLNRHGTRYPAIELEALALVFALREFRPYIEGAGTTLVRKDHSPLKALLTRQETTGRLAKYQGIIQSCY